ncbi:putative terminase large subunit [Bacillus phage vB_BceM-HSE3]|nr:putative terminase large subunit [Bacillus phage vB_BceM-HSE3]
MKVKSVTPLRNYTQKVYDVMESPTRNFVVVPNNSKNESGVVVHNCAMLDEIEFVKGADASMEKSAVFDLYANVKRRMESRFMNLGKIPGILFLVSSKKSDMDFLEQYIKTQKRNPNFMVVDEPQWRVHPSRKYSGETFPVAVGNKYLPSRVLSDNEDRAKVEAQGYHVIDVPIENKPAFGTDVNRALTDIAGIAMTSSSRFIYYDKLVKIINYKRPNPFALEEIVLDFDGPDEITDYLDKFKLSMEDIQKPCFIHIDASLTGDSTGFAMTTIAGAKDISRYERGDVVETRDLAFKLTLALAIKAKSGQQIPYHKIRKFIYYLRDELGVNVQGISADSFQSADMLQQLKLKGFNVKTISVDRSPKAYTAVRNSINEQRVELYHHEILERELVELEENKMSGKIDHPQSGSKDIADAVAGSLQHASEYMLADQIINYGQDAELTINLLSQGSSKSHDVTDDLWAHGVEDVIAVIPDAEEDETYGASMRNATGRILDW